MESQGLMDFFNVKHFTPAKLFFFTGFVEKSPWKMLGTWKTIRSDPFPEPIWVGVGNFSTSKVSWLMIVTAVKLHTTVTLTSGLKSSHRSNSMEKTLGRRHGRTALRQGWHNPFLRIPYPKVENDWKKSVPFRPFYRNFWIYRTQKNSQPLSCYGRHDQGGFFRGPREAFPHIWLGNDSPS